MGNAVKVLSSWLKEFIPALKVECIIIGVSLIAMSVCLWVVAATSGLTGKLTYLILHPGTTIPGILSGILLIIAAMTMKPVPREEM
jgi:hypothetical protein